MRLSVYFDQLLVPGPIAHTNWSGQANDKAIVPYNAWVEGQQVIAQCDYGPPAGPEDWCSYDPPPFDVMNLYLDPAAAFYEFPIAVI